MVQQAHSGQPQVEVQGWYFIILKLFWYLFCEHKVHIDAVDGGQAYSCHSLIAGLMHLLSHDHVLLLCIFWYLKLFLTFFPPCAIFQASWIIPDIVHISIQHPYYHSCSFNHCSPLLSPVTHYNPSRCHRDSRAYRAAGLLLVVVSWEFVDKILK